MIPGLRLAHESLGGGVAHGITRRGAVRICERGARGMHPMRDVARALREAARDHFVKDTV